MMTGDVAIDIGISASRQQIVVTTVTVLMPVMTLVTARFANPARDRDLAPLDDGVDMHDPGMIPESGGACSGVTDNGSGGDDGNGGYNNQAIHGLVLYGCSV
jgi:hypothetical protein